MTRFSGLLVAAAAIGGLAAPLAAQNYPYPPQPYPPQTYPQQTYPYQGQGYGYPGQPYGGNVMDQVIGQLLGTNYNVNDRRAVSLCASAAMAQAQNQYRGYNGYQQGYGGQYGYNQGYARPAMRVTAITDVQRKSSGLRVKGLIDSGYGGYGQYGQYGQYNQYGYQNQGYASGDLTFRCTVDYRGYVSNVRVERNDRRY